MAEKKPSVLIVDDELDVLDSLYDTFVDKYKVFKANSAKEALEIIKNNRIDLVISDQRMPETTGSELFEIMEKDHPHIGKVLLTGYGNIQTIADAINKGHIDKYIPKPWDEDDILHIVLEVLNTRLKKAIKERKHADQELKKTASLLQAALYSIHDGLIVIDLKGKIAHHNNRFQEMWGISDSILTSKDDQKALDFAASQLKDPESFLSKVKDLYNHPEAESFDLIEFKDGRIFERYSQPQKIGDQVVGRVWSFHDITEQRKAEAELKESHHELQEALDITKCITNIAPTAHIIADSKGIIISANPAAKNTFGYKTEEMIGKHVSMMTPPDRYDEYSKYIQDYLDYKKTGKPEKRKIIRLPKECSAIRKNGEEFPALIYIRESKVKDNEVFVGIIEDITERKREENRRKSAQQYIQSLIDSSMDMIISVDKNRKIVEFNKAAEKEFGYKKEEVLGKRIEMLYADSNEAKFAPVILEGTGHFSGEVLNRRKNGETFTSFVSASTVKDSDGNMLGAMGVSRDISVRKIAEEELRKAKERAEDASKAKDEFLSNMSHEIRTPLNGIIGMTELLMDTDIKDDQLNLIHTLNGETNSLLGIINNVLDFSKIEARKLELEKIPFDLRVTVSDVVNSFAYKAVQKGLELNCFLSPDLPSLLVGDPVRLKQILTNLTGNSLKFTHKGEIYIKGEMDEDLGDKVKIRFLVIDTGIGIPKDKQAAIFESFRQADGSTTRKYGGTGLGTTIARQLAELMEGEIGIESDEGAGSTFWFTAVFDKQIELDVIPTKEKLDLTDKKVLVVADHQTNRYVLREYLKSWGCLAVEVSQGKEALAILRESVSSQKPFDLILTDYQMFEMSGFDLTEEIRKIESLKEIPIILLSSVGEIGDAKSCRDKGIQGYLTKPIRQDYLHKAIESVLACSLMEEDQSGSQLVTRHTVTEEYGLKDFQLLLVEDYPTNQEVAMRHLHSAGYKVDLAENGKQAVEAYKNKYYDIIFMDIQMPLMDGYEATAKIRAHEKELANRDSQTAAHAVIIAMTAHATKGDQKKCLAAGMDEYITKPLRRKKLLDLVDRWVKKITDSRSSTGAEGYGTPGLQPAIAEDSQSLIVNNQPKAGVPIDLKRAIDEFEGDKEYLMKVLKGFLQNVSKQIKTIRQAISDGNAEVIKKEAHSIKGGAGNLTADNLSRIASELEDIGKSGDLKEGTEILEKLEKEFHRLEDYVEGVKESA